MAYDLSVATFSPDGRVFQVEYAAKAANATGLCLGAIVRDGVLLAVDKHVPSPLHTAASGRRVFKISSHVCAVVSGMLPDARALVDRAREEAAEYERIWGRPIPGSVIADRMGLFIHAHTAYWSTRPFGASMLLAVNEAAPFAPFSLSRSAKDTTKAADALREKAKAKAEAKAKGKAEVEVGGGDKQVDSQGGSAMADSAMAESAKADSAMAEAPESSSSSSTKYSLYLLDPTGAAYKYRGTAIGKNASAAKSDLEKLNLDTTTVDSAVLEFSKILTQHHTENKEQPMRIEMLKISNDGDIALVHDTDLSSAAAEARRWLDEQQTQ